MKKESAQILRIGNNPQANLEYSQPFQNIMNRWESIATELDTAFEQDKMSDDDPETHRVIEAIYDKAGREQREVFESVAKLNAMKLADVLVKLELWKAVTCPTPDSEEQLSLTESMLLSTYHDLRRMVDFNKEGIQSKPA